MPKVTAKTSIDRTVQRSIYDPEIASTEAGATDANYSDLSYLSGAIVDGGTNDMGYRGGAGLAAWDVVENADEWKTRLERQERLRRHTIEQGGSTWAFPKDATRDLTRRI